ncbi:MAG TPA: hypothetical protein VNI57_00560 [Candidatus Saccharimonadales bacterium]|nr:hypothetical protein [Candidatus Saccharimonadales bacterium]
MTPPFRSERSANRRARPRASVTPAAIALLALLCAALPARAAVAEHLLFEGLGTGEGWQTDDDSVLLSRNQGNPAADADVLLWQALQFRPDLHLFALEDLEGRTGTDAGAGATLEMFQLRYSRRTSAPLTVEAGKVTMPIGLFPDRHFADTNPLIGSPASYDYDSEYPYGIVVNGRISKFDYLASVVSLPLRDGRAMPEASHAPRPALGAGYTPFSGFRIGVYATRGPYLGRDVEDLLPAGTTWRDFGQEVEGFEVQLTRGYFVLNGEFALSAYEVPAHGPGLHGRSWYLDGRYTLSPRLFTALRVEQSRYPFILPISPFFWVAAPVDLWDAEAGVGYRIAPTTLLKVTYRRDLWPVDESIKPYYPEGYAVAVQISHRFDVLSWFDRTP